MEKITCIFTGKTDDKNKLGEDASKIINASIKSALPDTAVKKALENMPLCSGKIYLVSIGKAAWQMASAAKEVLQDKLEAGICITKYGHVKEKIEKISCFEAGHPILDENTVIASRKAIELVSNLSSKDLVIFLVSGGGSALFEDPKVSLDTLKKINGELLGCGADITEINTIRKRLSNVKGGRFAKICEPAKVYSIVLSDIIGDPLDMIASGPAYPDKSTCEDAIGIITRYNLKISNEVQNLLMEETPKKLSNVTTIVTGSVKQLCKAAVSKAKELGYEPFILTSSLDCEARQAGKFLASIAREYADCGKNLAFIMGGETVVKLTGNGLGGRNQELVLSAADGISGVPGTCIFSVGSDGTDGPTDAAGGIVYSFTKEILCSKGINIVDVLNDNDSYNALKLCEGLIKTGPTGTNVNDIAVLLIKGGISK